MPIFNTEYKSFEQGWQPGANTVAYFPLKTDLLDHGPNEYSMTNLGGTTLVDGAGYFNGSSRLYTISANSGLPLGTAPKTMLLYMKYISGITYCGFGKMYTSNNNKSFALCTVSGKIGFTTWGGGYEYASTVTPVSGQWYHVAVSYDGNNRYLYINGTLATNGTLAIGTDGNTLCLGASSDTRSGYENYFKGYLSEVIIENKAWTAQEISDYFDQTKSNYGL